MSDLLEKLLKSILTGMTISPETLKFDSTSNIIGTNGVIEQMWGVIASIATTLTILYFVLEINRKMMFERDDFTLKSIGAPLFKLIIAIAIIDNGVDIINGILSGHDALVTQAADWGSSADTAITYTAEKNPFKSFGLIQQLAIFIPMIVAWMISLVVTFLFWYKAIGYKIEFLFRIGITPIALADIYSGNNSNAIRWLKGFLGLVLYGVSFLVLPKIAYALADGMIIKLLEDNGTLTKDAINGIKNGKDTGSIIAILAGDSIWTVIKYIIMKMLAPIAALGSLSAVKQMTKEAVS